MPPLPPIQPIPQQLSSNYSLKIVSDASDPQALSMCVSSPPSRTRPASLSVSSTVSESTTAQSNGDDLSQCSSIYRNHADSFSTAVEKALVPAPPPPPGLNETISPPRPFVYVGTPADSDESKHTIAQWSLLSQLQLLSERSLAMHLHRAYHDILACQEAMWEELKDRLRNKKDQLKHFGWDDDEELEELQNRKRFELLIERFRGWVLSFNALVHADASDMQRHAGSCIAMGVADSYRVAAATTRTSDKSRADRRGTCAASYAGSTPIRYRRGSPDAVPDIEGVDWIQGLVETGRCLPRTVTVILLRRIYDLVLHGLTGGRKDRLVTVAAMER